MLFKARGTPSFSSSMPWLGVLSPRPKKRELGWMAVLISRYWSCTMRMWLSWEAGQAQELQMTCVVHQEHAKRCVTVDTHHSTVWIVVQLTGGLSSLPLTATGAKGACQCWQSVPKWQWLAAQLLLTAHYTPAQSGVHTHTHTHTQVGDTWPEAVSS